MGFSIGDVVSAGTRGDLVVVETRRVMKGKRAGQIEYNLAPLEADRWGQTYGVRTTGEGHLKPRSKEWTAKQINAAVERFSSAKGGVAKRKQEAVVAAREASAELAPGMLATIRYKSGNREEIVAAVNQKTGKIAIQAHGSAVRWIDPRHVVGARCPESALPRALSDRAIAKLLEQGWAQMRFGREVIHASCVVAFAREDAARGRDWDGASRTVYHDASLNLFWRDTGATD